jgi:hypothetical protein
LHSGGRSPATHTEPSAHGSPQQVGPRLRQNPLSQRTAIPAMPFVCRPSSVSYDGTEPEQSTWSHPAVESHEQFAVCASPTTMWYPQHAGRSRSTQSASVAHDLSGSGAGCPGLSYQVLVGQDGTGSASVGVTELSMLGAASCEPPPEPGTFDPPVPALVSVVAMAPQDAHSTATPTTHPRAIAKSYPAARPRTSGAYGRAGCEGAEALHARVWCSKKKECSRVGMRRLNRSP